ncbi:MAG: hypothetical protein MUE44_19910 [Oscillatoriaceae cyanobacterium Prado104]|nr:hypothetical protein [Oscillatoriaceae cyanobacterium Prado104]
MNRLTLILIAGCLSMNTIEIAKANPDRLAQLPQSPSISSQLQFLNGTWEGTYVCGQGLTRFKLAIAANSTAEIDAVFTFFAHPRNPSVPSGSFRMVGTYTSFNSPEIPGLLELKATTWINRPSGYLTVNLQGNVFTSEKRIIGEVTSSGCSKFDLIKTGI